MIYLCIILLATSVAGRFTDDLYRLLAKENADKNLIFSPFAVDIALSMVYLGAKGTTAEELRSTLEQAEGKKEAGNKYKEVFDSPEELNKDVDLELVNGIYVNDQYSLVPEYKEILRQAFEAEAVPISLKDASKAAAIVNKWVADETLGKITELVTPSELNPDLRALLLNAVYFKGRWNYKFVISHSMPTYFKVSKEKKIPFEIMSQALHLNAAYLDDLDAQVIELPYHNSNLSMLIFLPNKDDGLSELEDKIIGFSRPLSKMNVHVHLPKLKIEFKTSLNDPLQKLGIREAFGPRANFRGLAVNSDIYIQDVIHKAVIEVNEEGAVEKPFIGPNNFLVHVPETLEMGFLANHPFAYIIRDEKDVYFQGHVVRP